MGAVFEHGGRVVEGRIGDDFRGAVLRCEGVPVVGDGGDVVDVAEGFSVGGAVCLLVIDLGVGVGDGDGGEDDEDGAGGECGTDLPVGEHRPHGDEYEGSQHGEEDDGEG